LAYDEHRHQGSNNRYIEQLQKIGRQTFSETFSAVNTEENMAKNLEEGFSNEKQVTEGNKLLQEQRFR
jgi:hypothetical protein